jgi:hypothetical protein
MLSERDRRELADIEATLSRDDPVLDRTMSGGHEKAPVRRWLWYAGFSLSLLMVVAGALAEDRLIILAGVVGMVVAFVRWLVHCTGSVAEEDTGAGNDRP